MPPPRPSPARTCRDWKLGTRVNLERSLTIGDELGGHIVTGHVDGVATILAREAITPGDDPWGPTARFDDRGAARPFPLHRGEGLGLSRRHLAHGQLRSTDDVFSVLIIPHTLAVTTWGERTAGDRLNLEVDLMARYAARLAEAAPQG